MLLTTILALAAAPAPQTAPSPFTAAQQPTIATLGGAYVSPYAPPTSGSLVGGRLLELTLNVPGQTFQERFIVGIPANLQIPAPVLTLFHGYGEDPRQTIQRTSLVDEALQRGWLVFVPLGAHRFHYGIDYAQENIEYAFEFIGSRLPLDMDRVYGVGFSMGGGAVASYAARHLDPRGIRFAAIVNHTGTVSLEHTYATGTNQADFEHPLMFGGSPAVNPFGYRRSSTVRLDPFTGTTDPEDEMASNLSHVAVQNWFALMDPLQTLVEQTEALDDRLVALGASTTEHPVQSVVHEWSTLDAAAVVSWLAGQRLREVAPGDVVRTRADRDGRWHALDIEQRAAGDFTPVLWSAQPQVNALYLIEMENARAVGVDVAALGLDPNATLHLMTQVLDGQAPELRVSGLGAPPAAVQLRGAGTPTWSYDAQTDVLTVQALGTVDWGHWILVP